MRPKRKFCWPIEPKAISGQRRQFCQGAARTPKQSSFTKSQKQESDAGHLQGEEDRCTQKQRGLPNSLGGVRLRRALAGRIPQQRHPQVQRDVVCCGNLVCACTPQETHHNAYSVAHSRQKLPTAMEECPCRARSAPLSPASPRGLSFAIGILYVSACQCRLISRATALGTGMLSAT